MDIDPIRPEAAARYLHLARQFRSTAPASVTFRSFLGRKTFLRTPGVVELPHATVLPGEWLVLTGEQVLCDFLLQTPSPPLSAYLTRFALDDDAVGLLHEPPTDLAVTRAFLLGGCANYSHWLLDYLPRLRLCDDVGLPLLINGPLLEFQTESLRFLGVNTDRLLPLEYPGAWSVRHLLYPSICSSSFAPPHAFRVDVLHWLREAFALLMASDRRDRKLFISRAAANESHRRRLLNHAEIISIAERNGFEIVVPEQLNFAEQVRLFSQASVIAGAHGAGFANMVFAPREANLVELIGPRLSESSWSMGFVAIARLAGQSVTRIVGRSDGTGSIAFDHLPYETYIIDPAEFASVAAG